MADVIDRANDLAELQLQQALANRPVQPAGAGLEGCEDCGEPIPGERRLALPGCRLCVLCQQDAEGRARHVR